MKESVFKLRKEEGVTLIALIVTVIVLIILAGISIAMLSGDNGMIGTANDSQVETELSQLQERLDVYKLQREAVITKTGDYSNEISNLDLVNEGILKTVEVKDPKMTVGIINLEKLDIELNLGNNYKNIDVTEIDNLLDKFKEVNTSDNELKEFIEKQYNNLLRDKERVRDGGKLYTKIADLLTNNSVINKSASKMNDKELLTFITRYISVPLPPPIKQEDFNDLVKVGIKEDNREALWRLAVNYDKRMDFTLIEDYFIDKRDSYYLIELISATDSVNLDNIVSKVVATNDREFMIDLANRSLELSIFTKEDIDKIKEKYNL